MDLAAEAISSLVVSSSKTLSSTKALDSKMNSLPGWCTDWLKGRYRGQTYRKTARAGEGHSNPSPVQFIPYPSAHKAKAAQPRMGSPPETSKGPSNDRSRVLSGHQPALLRPRGYLPADRAANSLLAKLTRSPVLFSSLGSSRRNPVYSNVICSFWTLP